MNRVLLCFWTECSTDWIASEQEVGPESHPLMIQYHLPDTFFASTTAAAKYSGGRTNAVLSNVDQTKLSPRGLRSDSWSQSSHGLRLSVAREGPTSTITLGREFA